ncbi:nucleoporin subcomplex protein binding to Pom34-domain-containing protein [Peziza echinospora]|nr:nucleoporin subcomplex protein binding to Pom34-domain-containing protein [Peziza echinospora]
MATSATDLLDAALKNKATFLSWKAVYSRLTASPKTAAPALQEYLSAPSQVKTLSRPHAPFPPPSPASKQAFESKTAPVNFDSADQNGPLPPINTLKTEALTLSATLNIDELAALRIVVLEYQSRDTAALLNSPTASSAEETGGLFSFAKNSINATETETEAEKTSKALNRRIAIYLTERRYVIKTATFLVSASCTRGSAWRAVGRNLVSEMKTGDNSILEEIIKVLRKKLASEDGDMPVWVSKKIDEETSPGNDIGNQWEKQNLLESIHLLQLVFILSYRPLESTGTVITAWFKLMDDTAFLGRLRNPALNNNPDTQNLIPFIQPLASIISLTILSFDKIDDYLIQSFASDNAPSTGGVTFSDNFFYMKSSNAMKLITQVLVEHARNPVASLATFCWGLVLRRIWELLYTIGINLDDIDTLTPPDPSALATPAKRRKTGYAAGDLYLSTLADINSTSSHGKSTVAYLVKSAVNECKVYDVIQQLVTNMPKEGHGGVGWSMYSEADGWRMKTVLATFVRRTTEVMEFSSGIVGSLLVLNEVPISDLWRVLQGNDLDTDVDESEKSGESSDSSNNSAKRRFNIVYSFWNDAEAFPKIMQPAKGRFPHEPLPFLKLIRSLASDAPRTHQELAKVDTYTQVLPSGFTGYDFNSNQQISNGPGQGSGNGNGSVTGSVDESELGEIVLVEDLCLFAPRAASGYESSQETVGGGDITIPRGTKGKVISDTRTVPPVIIWDYTYSALTFFGRILECALVGSSAGGSSALAGRRGGGKVTDQLGNKEAVGDIIAILTTMILSYSIPSTGTAESRADSVTSLLELASDALAKNKDVVSIIFDILEEELQTSALRGGSSESTEFITIGMQFVDALASVLPNRVWPYLARSSLLERHGREGTLVRITGAIEVVQGDYSFTCSALKLFENLVEDGIKGIIEKSGLLGGNNRTGTGTGVSSSVQAGILEGWTHWGVDLFESYRGWKYSNVGERMEIGTRIATILTTILNAIYGVDDISDINSKITSILAPAAQHIVNVFLADSSSTLPLQPITGALQDGLATPESSLYSKPLGNWITHVTAAMNFAATLLRVRAYLGLPPSQLEHELYESAPVIAKVYGVHDTFRLPAIDLLEAMIIASGSIPTHSEDSLQKHFAEPPSLLGQLGTECASNFAQVMSRLDSPVHEPQLETKIWNLISAIVSNRQQGMSILLLRGETLALGFGGNTTTRPATVADGKKVSSILTIALNELSNLEKLDTQPERALAMLEAVALSQNFWSLAMEDLGRHPTFLSSMVKYLESFDVEFLPSDKPDVATVKANKVAVAAYIAQILAMHLHTKRASSARLEPGFINNLLNPKTLRFYLEQGVKITGYRASLHGNLGKNFEEKWPGLGLMKLKRTRLRKRTYGPDYFYDLQLAGKVLGFDRFWEISSKNGKPSARASGYKTEVEQANLNLSLIDSQVVLLRAWKIFAMELCPLAAQSPELSRALIKVVENCLAANIDMWQLPEQLTKLIFSERAEFGFIVMRKLSQQNNRPGEGVIYDGVFDNAWKAILVQKSEFLRALSTSEGIGYYRSLLRIMYMALLGQRNRKDALPIESCYKILDMIDVVVAQGFKELAAAAKTHPDTTNPEDIALITGILQASLRLKGVEVVHAGIGLHIAKHGTIRAATTLYSWAEKIGASDDGSPVDPVYGELSVLFMLELSYVKLLAEQLAVEPILDLLITSSLSTTIRYTMTAGLNNPLQHTRLHNIWSRGLLPILVNLLTANGPLFGPKIVSFLGFFGLQIELLVDSWGQRGNPITLSVIRETGTLVGLLEILRVWGVDIPAPKTLRKQPSADVDMIGSTHDTVNPFADDEMDDVVDGIRFDKGTVLEMVEYLLNHRNYLATLVVPTTEEEQKQNHAVDKGETGDKAMSPLVESVVKEMDSLRKLLTVVVGEEDGEKS